MSNKILWVYAPEHHTKDEGSKLKVHVTNDNKVLCGSYMKYGGGTCGRITLEWLAQPDPDNQMCKKCAKIALKILNPQP
jgi:hypothetical protein